MLRVNCGDIIINCRSLNLDKKLYAAIPIFGWIYLQIGYTNSISCFERWNGKSGEKVAQRLQIVSDQKSYAEVTLDGPSGGTCKIWGKNIEQCGQASAYGDFFKKILIK